MLPGPGPASPQVVAWGGVAGSWLCGEGRGLRLAQCGTSRLTDTGAQQVAQIIAYQQQHYDRGGFPGDGKQSDQIPLGSRILKVAFDSDTLISTGRSKEIALAEMNDRPGRYDPVVVAALSRVLAITNLQVVRRITIPELVDGLILADDIRTASGTLLCAKGQEIIRAIRFRLRNYLSNLCIQSVIKVFMPLEMASRFPEQYVQPASMRTEE